MKTLLRSLIALLVSGLAGCAAHRAPAARIDFQDPMVVEGSPLELELARKNEEELLAIGTAAHAAGDYARAASAFSHLADRFPGSRHRGAAQLKAGLAFRALEKWPLALERFRAAAKESEPSERLEASFRMAECFYNLERLEEARSQLRALAPRQDLPAAQRIRALDQLGIVELELGELEPSERSLEDALAIWEKARAQERLDSHHAAEAQYYLGEVWRQRFQAVLLDPAQGSQEQLLQALESKAQLLLSAQERYLKAAGMRDPDVAVAAGYRLGALYDTFYTQLASAPLPANLDEQQQLAYRRELGERVRVLLHKAISNYEETLTVAHRTGVTSAFVDAAQASLERMKGALREIDATAEGRL